MALPSQPTSLPVSRIFIGILTVIILFALWQIRSILLLTFASLILVVLFTMPVRMLTRRFGMGRPLAIALTLIGSIVLLILLSMLVFPTLFSQFTVLATEVIPKGVNEFINWWNAGGPFDTLPFLNNVFQADETGTLVIDEQVINQIVNTITGALGTLGGSVIPLVGGVANTVVSFLIVIFLSLYFLSEPQRYLEGIIKMTPMWYRERMNEVLYYLDDTLRAYLRVTAASMLVAGLGTGIGLALIGIHEWAALAVLTGVFSFIPNFGPILALIPAIAVAMVQVPDLVWLVIVVVYGVSFLQSQVVSPILASEGMNLAPVLILVGQIVFGIFFGFMGLLLAVPLTAVAVVLVREIFVGDVLGDRSAGIMPVLEDDLLPDEV